MVLGSGQYYCVSYNEEKCSIQLSIIFIPDTDSSAKQRTDLLQYFQTKLDEIMTDFMPAAKKPVAYIPCYHCNELHAELQLLLKRQQQHCPIKDQPIPKQYYTDLITDQGSYTSIVHCACNYTILLMYHFWILCFNLISAVDTYLHVQYLKHKIVC